MDIEAIIGQMQGLERLTALNERGFAYMVKVKPNEQEVESQYPNTLQAIMEGFSRLYLYEANVPELLAEIERLTAIRDSLDGFVEPSEAVLDMLSDREELKKWIGRAAWHCMKVDTQQKEIDRLRAELDRERKRAAGAEAEKRGMTDYALKLEADYAVLRERAEALEKDLFGQCDYCANLSKYYDKERFGCPAIGCTGKTLKWQWRGV